jgi:hypothetical protein
MRKTMLLAAIMALTVLMMAAAPAMADVNNHNDRNHNDRNNDNNFFRHDNDNNFFERNDFEDVLGFENADVDVEEVGDNNDLEGECVLTDVDVNGNGVIDDADITCFV